MSTGKGKKRMKNSPVIHTELKKHRGVMLTNYAWQGIQKKAVYQNISASEYLEQLIRYHLEGHGE